MLDKLLLNLLAFEVLDWAGLDVLEGFGLLFHHGREMSRHDGPLPFVLVAG